AYSLKTLSIGLGVTTTSPGCANQITRGDTAYKPSAYDMEGLAIISSFIRLAKTRLLPSSSSLVEAPCAMFGILSDDNRFMAIRASTLRRLQAQLSSRKRRLQQNQPTPATSVGRGGETVCQ